MLDGAKTKLGRLRRVFDRKADEAYEQRDAATSARGQSYAAGKAEAFGTAEDEVRKAQKD